MRKKNHRSCTDYSIHTFKKNPIYEPESDEEKTTPKKNCFFYVLFSDLALSVYFHRRWNFEHWTNGQTKNAHSWFMYDYCCGCSFIYVKHVECFVLKMICAKFWCHWWNAAMTNLPHECRSSRLWFAHHLFFAVAKYHFHCIQINIIFSVSKFLTTKSMTNLKQSIILHTEKPISNA